MSKTIDEKVVSMQFDNSHFEKNVQTSLGTLDKLKNSLKFDGATKGFSDISTAAGKCDMSTLGKGIETVKTKFSALQVMAVTALANITNSAVNAGKQLVSSLTIEPIKEGFKEYELTLNTIQTTMAGTGKTMEEVEEELKRLDKYADDTVYSSADMFNNLPKFTNAGVELERATTAMIGIANATALAGGDAGKASIAFYNLGQSIGTGYLSRMDYNSINNAGIATMEWKNQMVDAAIAQGKLTKAGEDAYVANGKTFTLQSLFIDGLQEQWASTEVLMDVFEDYGDTSTEIGKKAQAAAQDIKTFTMLMDSLSATAGTGWKDTWQIIVGDLEEAKVLWTAVGEAIGGFISDSAEARNELLQGWKDLGGRDDLIEGFKNAFEGILSIIKPIKEAFSEIFPPVTAEQLAKVTETFKNLTSHLKMNDEQAAKIKSTFKGLFAVFDIVVTAIKEVAGGVKKLLGNFTGLDLNILDITASFGDFLTGIRDTIKETDLFGKAIDKAVDFITNIIDKIKEFSGAIKDSFNIPRVDGFSGFIGALAGKIEELGESIRKTFDGPSMKGFMGFLSTIAEFTKGLGSKIVESVSNIGSGIAKAFGKGDFFEVISSGLLAGITVYIVKFVKGLSEAVSSGAGALENLTGILDGVRGCLEAYQNQIKAGMLLKIAIAIGILAAAIFVISTIDSDSLSKAIMAISVLFGELVGSLAILNKMQTSLIGVTKTVGMMLGMSVAVLILSAAMKKLADLNWDELGRGIVGIGGIVAILVAAAKVMESESSSVTKFAGQMILMSVAIGILAKICVTLSSMSWEELAKAGTGLLGITIILVAAAKVMDSNSKSITKFAGQMLIMSLAIGILGSVCKTISSMSWEELAKGGTGILGITAILVAAAKIMDSDSKSITKFAGQMILMSVAIGILTLVGKSIAEMSWEEIAKAGVSILGLVTILVASAKIMSAGSGSVTKSAGQMLIMAVSLAILAPVLQSLGSMSLAEIGKGLLAIGGSIAILAIGLNAMNGTLAGSAAMLIAAAALSMLAPALQKLGSMSWGEIAKSLVTLAGAFLVIGVAGLLLGPLVPAILGLAVAFALFGVSMIGIGAGLTLIGVGLTTISAAGAAAATALVASLAIIVTGFLDLIPTITGQIGDIIVAFCALIGEVAPQIADAVLKLASSVLESLAQYTPQIVSSLMTFLIGLIDGIALHLPELLVSIMNLVGSIFQGIVDALNSVDTTNLLKGVIAVALTTALMFALSAVVPLIPMAMVGILGVGAVIAEMAIVFAAIGALAQLPGLQWLIGEGGNLLQKIGTAIGQFVGGIIGGFGLGVTDSLPAIATNLSTFMTNIEPFISGAKEIDDSMFDGVKSLTEVILLLTAADILNGIASFITGGNSMEKFAEQIIPFGKAMKEYSDEVTGIDDKAVTASATAAESLAALAKNLPNSGGLVSLFTGDNDLSEFAEKLVPFGTAIKEYADEVTGIDADAVTASATAAESLAALAKNLPNSGGLVSLFTGDNDLAEFAEKLVPFGEAMKKYADSVIGIDADAVVASVTAAESLSALASKLPNSDGLVSLFTGDNNLGDFAEEIIPFGKSMKEYSNAVSGIDEGAIIASANGGKALSELATNLPNSGGLVSLFTGDNSLATFGDQLAPFGEGMKSYSDSVSGIDTEAVESSINGAKALSGLATNLPNSGGLVSLFTGDNSLATFGDQLAPFGASMKAYSDSVIGIDADAVTASATAAKSLSALANELPNSGGFVGLFTGDNGLGSFGEQLPSFGESMKAYSDSVAGINATVVQSSVTCAEELVDLVNKTSDASTFGVAPFVEAINTLATVSVDNLVAAFNNSSGRVSSAVGGMIQAATNSISSNAGGFTTAINNLVSSALNSMNSNKGQFQSSGSALMVSLRAGIVSGSSPISPAIKSILNKAVSTIKSSQNGFRTSGALLMTKFAQGIKTSNSSINSAISSMVSSCATKLKSGYSAFYASGIYVSRGFAEGIGDSAWRASTAATAMANAAKQAAKNALKINSPSKVFRAIAYSIPEGFAQGINNRAYMAEESAESMANLVVESTKSALSQVGDVATNNIDIAPTVRPVLDMSNMQVRELSLSSSLDASLIRPVESLSQIVSDAQAKIDASNNRVINAISELREDLSNYYSGDGAEVALYVDSKKLATSIAKPMNRQLNILSKQGGY